jgi:CRISPR-associated endoribonuclease Cas6
MRIKIEFTQPTREVPVDTQKYVNGYIHKCLGENNEYHDSRSDYSVSNLKGGKLDVKTKTLSFPNRPYIVVSSEDEDFLGRIISGCFNNDGFAFGMVFHDVHTVNENLIDGWNHFFTLDPILLREKRDNGKNWFVTVEDSDFGDKLRTHIIDKFSKVDPTLDLSDLELKVGHGKKKRITVKDNVWCMGSAVKVMVKTNKRVASKLYNYGLGQSTGSGFGTIYKTENFDTYKF